MVFFLFYCPGVSRDLHSFPRGGYSRLTSQDWPMHRYDTSRSAASPTTVPETLATRWKVSVGRPLNATTDGPWRIRSGMPISAPVIAGDTVFVCDEIGRAHV